MNLGILYETLKNGSGCIHVVNGSPGRCISWSNSTFTGTEFNLCNHPDTFLISILNAVQIQSVPRKWFGSADICWYLISVTISWSEPFSREGRYTDTIAGVDLIRINIYFLDFFFIVKTFNYIKICNNLKEKVDFLISKKELTFWQYDRLCLSFLNGILNKKHFQGNMCYYK